MKTSKTLIVVIGLLMIALFGSCQKEKVGVYAPKKKIQQIYYSWSSTEKQPYQHWVWDGDKLSSITHYFNFDMKGDTWEEVFTYEDNRLARVDDPSHLEYITYNYSDNHLRTATVFFRNTIVCTWAIGYEGDRISQLTGTFYSKNTDGHEMRLNPLSHLLPLNLCQQISLCEKQEALQRHNNESYSISLKLSWEKNNISKVVCANGDDYIVFQLQYDDKCCPLYGFMGGLDDYVYNFSTGHTGFTKNNVTSLISTEDHYVDTIHYAYQYDRDKYPILQTMYYSENTDEKRVFYYEY